MLMLGVMSIAQAQEGRSGASGQGLENGGAGASVEPGAGSRGGREEPGADPSAAEAPALKPERSEGPSIERRATKDDSERGARARATEHEAEPARSDKNAKDASHATKERRSQSQAAERSGKASEKRDHAPANRASEPSGAASKSDDASAARQRAESKPERPAQAARVDLSGDKRGRVRDALSRSRDVERKTNIDIDVSVGRRLPRDWHYRPVPVAVVDIVPEYRDYLFVYVDDEYVITDPGTYEVVAIIPAQDGAQHAGGGNGNSTECPNRLQISRDERELILGTTHAEREVDVGDLEVGWSVPRDVELYRFPDPVLSEAGELSACRYFVAKHQIAIVDPEDEKVVLVIDKG